MLQPTSPFHDVPTYSLAERDRRWALANRLMEAEGLDALLVYGDRELAFPAGFAPDTWFTNDRPGCIVILPKDREPIAVAFLPTVVEDHIQAARSGKTGWLRAENIHVGKMGSNVAQIRQDRELGKATIGVVGHEFYPPFYFDGAMPWNTWQSIVEDVPEARFRDVGSQFRELTAVKSEEELAVLRWSADVGEKMCAAMRDATAPGVPENDIYAAAMYTAHANLAFTTEILLGSGPDYVGWGPPAWTYRPEPPRVIEAGDVVLSEVFCSFGMLETQHQPAIAVGKVHADFDRAAEAARASYEAGVAALKTGNSFGDVVEAMKAPMATVDAWHVHPLVHSMNPFGLIGTGDRMADLPEAGRYAQMFSIPTVGVEAELRPGMTFALEPNAAIGRRVVNLGGTVIVGQERGIELNEIATHLIRV